MKTIRLGILSVVTLLLQGCFFDGFDFDKISDQVYVETSLMLPVATAEIDVAYIFGEIEDNVVYYTDDDGNTRLRIEGTAGSAFTESAVNLLGLDIDIPSFSKTLDLSDYSSLLSTTRGSTLDLPTIYLSFDYDGIEMTSFSAAYELVVEFTDFSRTIITTFTIGETSSRLIAYAGTDKSNTVECETQTIELVDGCIPIDIELATSTTSSSGSLGTIGITLNITDIESITGTVDSFDFSIDETRIETNLEDFKLAGTEMNFRDPRIYIVYNNDTDLRYYVTPEMVSEGDDDVELETFPFYIEPATSDSVEYNNDNSNVSELIQNIPDYMMLTAAVTATPSSDDGTVTLTQTDSLTIGYSYMAPVEFTIDCDIYTDTASVDEIDDLEKITACKIVCNATNGIPLECGLTLIFYNSDTDEEYTTIEIPDLVEAPELDDNGIAIGTISNTSTVELTSQQIEYLDLSDKIIITVHIASPGDDYVVPLADNTFALDISIAAEVDLSK